MIVIAEPQALALAVERGVVEHLPTLFQRLLLSPTTVERLIEQDKIDALAGGEVEAHIEVVSLTQEGEVLAQQLAESMRALDGAEHRAAAEAMALMRRPDLGATLFLCNDEAALSIAVARGIPARRLDAFLDRVPRATPSTPRPNAAPPLRRDAPLGTVELDEESRALIEALMERGVGKDAREVIHRALRGLAAALG